MGMGHGQERWCGGAPRPTGREGWMVGRRPNQRQQQQQQQQQQQGPPAGGGEGALRAHPKAIQDRLGYVDGRTFHMVRRGRPEGSILSPSQLFCMDGRETHIVLGLQTDHAGRAAGAPPADSRKADGEGTGHCCRD